MIDEETQKRMVEAKSCNDCISWHHHCKAECCKIIFLNINPKVLGEGIKFLSIKVRQPLKDYRYYLLRDVEYLRGVLRFKKSRIIVVGRKVMYFYPCNLLEGNLCKSHLDNKPELCKILTLETARLPGQPFELTDNCLFRYK